MLPLAGGRPFRIASHPAAETTDFRTLASRPRTRAGIEKVLQRGVQTDHELFAESVGSPAKCGNGMNTKVMCAMPPANSSIVGQFTDADLLGCYAIDLWSGTSLNMRLLATTMLESPPAWFRVLLFMRDTAIRLFGVKTSSQIRLGASQGDRIEFFPVQSEYQDEIVLGENEIHLDFRFSLLRQSTSNGPRLFATTVVHCHGRPGRIYLALIAPFHRLVVRTGLARLARRLQAAEVR